MEEKPIQGIADLYRLVSLYQESLDGLLRKLKRMSCYDRKFKRVYLSNQIIAILQLRDEIEQLKGVVESQKTNNPYHNNLYHDIVTLDVRLKHLSRVVANSLHFTKIRDLIKPPAERWWWYPVQPLNRFLNRINPFLGFLSIACLICFLALAIDLIPRFFASGPNILGGLAVVITPLASWFFGKEALEKAPQSKAILEKAMAAFNIPLEWRQVLVFILSLFFARTMYFLYASKGEIAKTYYCLTLNQVRNKVITEVEYAEIYEKKSCDPNNYFVLPELILPALTTPKSKLDVAIAMNPTDPDVHFLLGRIYELRQDLELARAEYKSAMDSGNQTARIRIVLLYLLEDQEKSANIATSILMQAGDFDNEKDEKHRKSLYTLRAWARYSQSRYSEAIDDLDNAKELFDNLQSIYKQKKEPQPALFYCVRAAVLEKQKKYHNADESWNECGKVVKISDVEDDFWKMRQNMCISDENRKKKQSSCLMKAEKEK
jgi:tetratricopeptide (TPR) repeat protein